MVAVPVAVLKAVLPPLGEVLAVLPAEPSTGFRPLVRSQATKVKVAVPLKLAFGRKRIMSLLAMPSLLASRRRAALAVGLPKSLQVRPPSSEYCQLPFVLSTL